MRLRIRQTINSIVVHSKELTSQCNRKSYDHRRHHHHHHHRRRRRHRHYRRRRHRHYRRRRRRHHRRRHHHHLQEQILLHRPSSKVQLNNGSYFIWSTICPRL